MRSSAVHQSVGLELTGAKTLPGPGRARKSSRPLPVAASATRIDQGSAASGRGRKAAGASQAGRRTKAIDRPSGDQIGSMSVSTEGSSQTTRFAKGSRTPTKPCESRPETNAIRVPSGDQRGVDCEPGSLVACAGLAFASRPAIQS